MEVGVPAAQNSKAGRDLRDHPVQPLHFIILSPCSKPSIQGCRPLLSEMAMCTQGRHQKSKVLSFRCYGQRAAERYVFHCLTFHLWWACSWKFYKKRAVRTLKMLSRVGKRMHCLVGMAGGRMQLANTLLFWLFLSY